jgi:hypothetical protein
MRRFEASQGDQFGALDAIPEPQECPRCSGRRWITVVSEEKIPCNACSGRGQFPLPSKGAEQIRRFAQSKVDQLRAKVVSLDVQAERP